MSVSWKGSFFSQPIPYNNVQETWDEKTVDEDQIQHYLEGHLLKSHLHRNLSIEEIKSAAAQAVNECKQQLEIDENGKVDFVKLKEWYDARFQQGDEDSFSISIPQAVYCYLHSVDSEGYHNYINSGGLDPSIRREHNDAFVGFIIEIRQGTGFLRMIRRFSQLKNFVDQLKSELPQYVLPVGFPSMQLVEPDANIRRKQLETFFVELLKNPEIRQHHLYQQFFNNADGPNLQYGYRILHKGGHSKIAHGIWRRTSTLDLHRMRSPGLVPTSAPSFIYPQDNQETARMIEHVDGQVKSLSQFDLDVLNVAQQPAENKRHLDDLDGPDGLARHLGVDLQTGLSSVQFVEHSQRYGTNRFPEKPLTSFWSLLLAAFNDYILLVLIAASVVSIILGIFVEKDLAHGYVEGTAILIAVMVVAFVSAGNDYVKELQFRALEKSSQADEQCTVVRDGEKTLVNPSDITVGDVIVLQAGNGIPADCVIVDESIVKVNESALTGEAVELKKSRNGDPFLLSSCTITEADEVHALAFGIGPFSQWGKIRANLVTSSANTPLQDKLEDMTKFIGYIGTGAALATFVVLMVYVFVDHKNVQTGIIDAIIISLTIIVVAIPEGLPLAVTISLAYSTRKMYVDQCFIKVLAACETMGNATNICSDKTGTLTENRMTIVEGWFGNKSVDQDSFASPEHITPNVKKIVAENSCINRTGYLVLRDALGNVLERPEIVGNATEGALIVMAKLWGFDYEEVEREMFVKGRDKLFGFNSKKKRSSAVVHRPGGTVRVYVKGAPEWVIRDCKSYLSQSGEAAPLDDKKQREIDDQITSMANRALRTLCLAHRDFPTAAELPEDWEETPPDSSDLTLDAIVGITDPLRSDVKEAVATAQAAGVTVRMCTGDNIHTASAIARECGILTENGVVLEGPQFRAMTLTEVDSILPRLQVLARSSPDDKLLLVTRLNGHGLPTNRQEWEAKHVGKDWDTDRDRLLPGYREEWISSRPEGGEVVAVTGDGTNDAPALKAANVGMAMGKTGTQVAKDAADIVILDDKFSSILRAILWGRCVYDNIRRFLQFQLTVNIVALLLVFIGCVAGFDPPLNAVMMLWVNLIMDTLGALAIGTEPPTPNLLSRRPYKRTSFLISRPMWRNILVQSAGQLILLLTLLFSGPQLLNIEAKSKTHYTIIFNSFVLWQIFNEFNSRNLFDEVNVFRGVHKNPIFIAVIASTLGMQALLVELGGSYVKTTGLTGIQWLTCILLGGIALPLGFLLRFIPVKEDPRSFASYHPIESTCVEVN